MSTSLIETKTRNSLFEYLKLSNFLGSNQSSELTFTFDDLRKKPLNIYAIKECDTGENQVQANTNPSEQQNKPKSKTRPNKSRQKENQDSYKNAEYTLLANEKEMSELRSQKGGREGTKLSNLEDIENVDMLDEEIDLNSDEWINVNPNELKKRYDILRRYAVNKINVLKNETNKLDTNEKDKRDFMKKQFVEHKKLWETERSELMDQAELAFRLQVEAHNAAEQAIQQLEEYMIEEEKLDTAAEKQFTYMRRRSHELSNMSYNHHEKSLDKELSLSLPEVIDSDENIMNEIRISIESRNSLRTKHTEQLAERKLHLEELKNKLSKQFAPQDKEKLSDTKETSFSSNNLIVLNERPMSRAFSTLTNKTTSSRVNSARFVIIEYLKIYDSILSMKNSLMQTLQLSKKQNLTQFAEELKRQKTIEIDTNSSESDQIAKIKTNVEDINLLIQNIFRKIVNELIKSSYEIQEKGKNEDRLKQNFQQQEQQYTKRIKDLESLKENAKIKEEIINQDKKYFELKMKYEKLLEERVAESIIFEDIKKESELKITDLQKQIEQLKNKLQEEKPKKEDETQHEEIAPSIMFTRLDAERNAKRLKKAITKGNVSENDFKNAFQLMNDYVSIPAQRFVALVKKYVRFKNLQAAKEALQKSQEASNKTETLIEKMKKNRGSQLSAKMEELQVKRMKIATDLMHKLDNIEQQSGIFLIKPMYSFKGRNVVEDYLAKQEQDKKSRLERNAKKAQSAKEFSPQVEAAYPLRSQTTISRISKPTSEPTIPTWSVQDSLSVKSSERLPLIKSISNMSIPLTTPKILEVDINRMMFSQNQISSNINANDDVNANLRSYVAVNRPSGFIKKSLPVNPKIDTPFTPVNSTFEGPIDSRKLQQNESITRTGSKNDRKSAKSEIDQIQEGEDENLSDNDKDSVF